MYDSIGTFLTRFENKMTQYVPEKSPKYRETMFISYTFSPKAIIPVECDSSYQYTINSINKKNAKKSESFLEYVPNNRFP